ncbi:MAG: glycosyltransferase [Nitrososphaera sp.]|nr:glycosyltransferase [Nitrososphaera sp.]
MRILLIAYYFPPDSSSGSFRPLFFANHLTEMGDQVTVLTSRIEDFLADQPVDQDLVARLDHRIRVVRSVVHRPDKFLLRMRNRMPQRSGMGPASAKNPAAKNGIRAPLARVAKKFVAQLLSTPDYHAGWITSCVRQGLAIIREQKPDIILATGGPWTGLVAGKILKQLTKVPLALDFRDPWLANPDPVQRGSVFGWIDGCLEKGVLGSADMLIANTEEIRQDFLRRYPSLSPEWVVTITNGFEDYLPDSSPRRNRALTLTHVGALYFSRNPLPLLEAARNVIERGGIDPMKIKLRFVGGIAPDNLTIAEILASRSMANVVEVIPRVTYQASLRAMIDTNVLILYQPGFPLQVPRKVYDYMAARRPVLCIADPGSATWSLVERYSIGIACENDVAQLEAALLTMYGEWQKRRLVPIIDDRFDPFRNHTLTLRLRNYLEQKTRMSARSRGATLRVPRKNHHVKADG